MKDDIYLNKVTIKGERCSGTNYLTKLLQINFPKVVHGNLLGWKHSYLNIFQPNINNSDEFLVILMFRDPYEWLKSFYLSPHHICDISGNGLWGRKVEFSEFIRMNFKQMEEKKELFYEKHPFTLENPKNILELRKWKIENFLNHRKILKNTYYLKYEDLNNDPEKILKEINNKWLSTNFTFKNWYNYKATNIKYNPKKYEDISKNDMDYLLNNIDWELEKKIGYEPIKDF